MEFDSSEIDKASATVQEQEKAYAEEVERVWTPFGKVCCAFLGVAPYSKKVRLTKEITFYSTSTYKDMYRFDFFYKRKPILRVSMDTAQGYTIKPIGFGLLYRRSTHDLDPLAEPFVDDSVFFFDGAYVEQIQEAFEIMKSQVKARKDKQIHAADTDHAFHKLTFTEHTMKLTDAIATLNLLEESLSMLVESRMQEMEMVQAAKLITQRPDPVAAMNQLNLGNLTYDGQKVEGVRAVEAFDQALASVGANSTVRTAATKKLKAFWRQVNPSNFDTGPSALDDFQIPSMKEPQSAPRTYGTAQTLSRSTQSSINRVSPEERAALARKFQANLAKKREQKRRKARKSL